MLRCPAKTSILSPGRAISRLMNSGSPGIAAGGARKTTTSSRCGLPSRYSNLFTRIRSPELFFPSRVGSIEGDGMKKAWMTNGRMIKNTSATAIMPDSKTSETERAVSDLDDTNAKRISESATMMPRIQRMFRFASVSGKFGAGTGSVSVGCMVFLMMRSEKIDKKSRRRGPATVLTRTLKLEVPLFFDSSRFADLLAKIKQLCTADQPAPGDFNPVDARRVDQKCPLHPVAV